MSLLVCDAPDPDAVLEPLEPEPETERDVLEPEPLLAPPLDDAGLVAVLEAPDALLLALPPKRRRI